MTRVQLKEKNQSYQLLIEEASSDHPI